MVASHRQRRKENEMPEMFFKLKDQIAYIPTHANGDIEHPDVEHGFVTSVLGDTVFCRYWSKSHPRYLRTTANSEGRPIECLVHHHTAIQSIVDNLFKELGY